MSEIPNDTIPKIESVYTKENGWKTLAENAKAYAVSEITKSINKNNYQGSVYVGASGSESFEVGYKRIIQISGIDGVPAFWVGKKKTTVLDTSWLTRRNIVNIWELNPDFETLSGTFRKGTLDLNDKAEIDSFVRSYVKDKPDFYVRMLDQLRTQTISRENKRLAMAILEMAVEMGANGTTPFLVAKEIDPNSIPTTTGGTGTGSTTTGGIGTGSAGSGTSTGSNMALIGLGILAVGLLLANSDENKD